MKKTNKKIIEIINEHRARNKSSAIRLRMCCDRDWQGQARVVTDRFHEKLRTMQHQPTVFRVVATREL